ncbi:Histidine kinase-, DNA gyrase B-, and HSP90-like ATPase [Geodermatophilus dictyosporus]|uniref:histidine kinase n=1 Tax=Geodermatophilus dictyosporus TaxID=1523247 RepID=A0A1I5U5D0_9ACTN|nr:GAF domain-containing sensor histidine kinase [Geodermatophilus dictyosporus]SFP90483.1 Histidine kinase-, DNA gyrase B-, and HSP90-like ATPase [Geodermatophilus dictyosporus]
MPAVPLTPRAHSDPGSGRLVGAVGAAVTLGLGVFTVVGAVRTGTGASLPLLATVVPAGLLGSVVVAARRADPVGRSLLAGAVLFLLGCAGEEWVLLGLPGRELAVWSQTWTYQTGLVPLFVLVPLYFPDGRLPSPRWRPVARAAVVLTPVVGLVVSCSTGAVSIGGVEHPNPFALPVPAWTGDALGIPVLVLVVLAAASVVVRLRRTRGPERARVALLVYAVVLTSLAFLTDGVVAHWWPDAYEGVFAVVQVVPVTVVAAATVSVLRHRLFDVERVLDRTLLWSLLTGCVLLGYVAVVGAFAAVSVDGAGVGFLAVAVVAVAVTPLRARLQRRVDRLVYGDRADPYRTLTLLGRRLGSALTPAAALASVVTAVADALRLPFVAIESRTPRGYETAAAHGDPPSADAEPVTVPLVHAGEEVGRLVLGGRGRRVELAPGDRRLLEDLARQVGVALHAVQVTEEARRLAADLQRSRERLVLAREEERRRIGRDLHDGLGPQLAGLTMTVEAARDLVGVDDTRARELLDGLLRRSDAAVGEVRRIAHLLRPPALDALGLEGALRSHAATVRAPDVEVAVADLPPLPAAVEVAAYRIALEAVHNAAVHAAAATCRVVVRCEDDALHLTVTDDGRGLPPVPPAGVGLSSMAERAAELGGRCTVTRGPTGGTVLEAALPCTAGAPGGR